MNRAEGSVGVGAARGARSSGLPGLVGPILIAVVVVAVVLLVVVESSKSAWALLGAGRGLVPEEYYHVSAFVLVLATTVGQAVGWAGGSALLYHVMTLVGVRATWITARIAMSLVYLGLGGGPLFVYHILYGQWLLGLPRTGLSEWLGANYPDARWLLLDAHDLVDLSPVPLGVIFLGVLWGLGEGAQRNRVVQTILALALLGTSLAVALSLGIHSTLVHIRL